MGEQLAPLGRPDYVIDAIDTIAQKLALAAWCQSEGLPLISAMGGANKLDPTLLRVSDITETSVCPLARIMRKELRRRGVEHLKVVWSPEEPRTAEAPSPEEPSAGRRSIPGSVAFVPAAAGLILAAEVVKDLCTQR